MKNKKRTSLPTTFVIFGATGDLVRRKIISSLLRLYCLKYLPEKFQIIGVSRRDYSDQRFREFLMENAIKGVKAVTEVLISGIFQIIYFIIKVILKINLYIRVLKIDWKIIWIVQVSVIISFFIWLSLLNFTLGSLQILHIQDLRYHAVRRRDGQGSW